MAKDIKRYVTPVFRMSFPSVFEADSYKGSEPKFGLTAVWDPKKFTTKDKQRWKELAGAMNAASLERFNKKWKELPGNVKRGIRDGEEKADLEGFGEGTYFASVTSKMRPGVIDANKNPIGAEHGNTEEIYAGCYCRATVSIYSYDNVGKGIGIGLFNIQKVADGEPLSARTDAEDDFDDVDDEWLEGGDDSSDDSPF